MKKQEAIAALLLLITLLPSHSRSQEGSSLHPLHEEMDRDFPPRVIFTVFNPESFNIRFIHRCTPPDFWKYCVFCESVNLQIFRAFEEQGIQFSLPQRHLCWKVDDQQGPLEITCVATATSRRREVEAKSGYNAGRTHRRPTFRQLDPIGDVVGCSIKRKPSSQILDQS